MKIERNDERHKTLSKKKTVKFSENIVAAEVALNCIRNCSKLAMHTDKLGHIMLILLLIYFHIIWLNVHILGGYNFEAKPNWQ